MPASWDDFQAQRIQRIAPSTLPGTTETLINNGGMGSGEILKLGSFLPPILLTDKVICPRHKDTLSWYRHKGTKVTEGGVFVTLPGDNHLS